MDRAADSSRNRHGCCEDDVPNASGEEEGGRKAGTLRVGEGSAGERLTLAERGGGGGGDEEGKVEVWRRGRDLLKDFSLVESSRREEETRSGRGEAIDRMGMAAEMESRGVLCPVLSCLVLSSHTVQYDTILYYTILPSLYPTKP